MIADKFITLVKGFLSTVLVVMTKGLNRWTDDLNVWTHAALPVEKIKDVPVSGDALKIRGWKDYLK